jgi:uncharacterized protein (DUF427 family)
MAHITITPTATRYKISAGSTPLGETTHAVTLQEGSAAPVLYIPRADIDMKKLAKTDRQTNCPHKGACSYYSVQTDAGLLENAVWSYEAPKQGVEAIAGHLAFYPNKISVTPA